MLQVIETYQPENLPSNVDGRTIGAVNAESVKNDFVATVRANGVGLHQVKLEIILKFEAHVMKEAVPMLIRNADVVPMKILKIKSGVPTPKTKQNDSDRIEEETAFNSTAIVILRNIAEGHANWIKTKTEEDNEKKHQQGQLAMASNDAVFKATGGFQGVPGGDPSNPTAKKRRTSKKSRVSENDYGDNINDQYVPRRAKPTLAEALTLFASNSLEIEREKSKRAETEHATLRLQWDLERSNERT